MDLCWHFAAYYAKVVHSIVEIYYLKSTMIHLFFSAIIKLTFVIVNHFIFLFFYYYLRKKKILIAWLKDQMM